jgi:hypothetical protein
MDAALGFIIVGVCVTIILVYRLSHQLSQTLSKHFESGEHDDLIEKQTSREVQWYIKRRDQIEAEKQELPEIDLWAINANSKNWEQDLIAGAQKLRNLIVEAYGDTPDTVFVSQEAQKVPMTYELAHDLADLAHLTKELGLKETEWQIKKIELLGAMRKRQTRFDIMASEEFELRALERQIDETRSRGPTVKKAVLESFRAAKTQKRE